MREVDLISTYKEYLSCIRKWNDYSPDEQETLRAKYYQENKEKEKQRYRNYYQDNKGNEKARLRRVKTSLQSEQK